MVVDMVPYILFISSCERVEQEDELFPMSISQETTQSKNKTFFNRLFK